MFAVKCISIEYIVHAQMNSMKRLTKRWAMKDIMWWMNSISENVNETLFFISIELI